MVHGTRKKPSDFCGNQDHIKLGLILALEYSTVRWDPAIDTGYVLAGVRLAVNLLTVRVLHDQRFWREVRAVPNAILVLFVLLPPPRKVINL